MFTFIHHCVWLYFVTPTALVLTHLLLTNFTQIQSSFEVTFKNLLWVLALACFSALLQSHRWQILLTLPKSFNYTIQCFHLYAWFNLLSWYLYLKQNSALQSFTLYFGVASITNSQSKTLSYCTTANVSFSFKLIL